MNTSDLYLHRIHPTWHPTWTEYLNITWQLQHCHLNLYLKCAYTSQRDLFRYHSIFFIIGFPF